MMELCNKKSLAIKFDFFLDPKFMKLIYVGIAHEHLAHSHTSSQITMQLFGAPHMTNTVRVV